MLLSACEQQIPQEHQNRNVYVDPYEGGLAAVVLKLRRPYFVPLLGVYEYWSVRVDFSRVKESILPGSAAFHAGRPIRYLRERGVALVLLRLAARCP
eukprot:969561-Pleurochrysis_carterae.AAC.1